MILEIIERFRSLLKIKCKIFLSFHFDITWERDVLAPLQNFGLYEIINWMQNKHILRKQVICTH